jgi:putative nucleotidyltransferase with HDIG domain
VSILAEQLCRELGLGEAACETVRIAGILHDIGKIGMPELVLKKPGRLTTAELEIFKRHSQLGSRIVSAVTELEEVGRAILHHHERFDGGGYPDQLVGDRIPLLSRILAVCDSYDAMTSDRPYRDSVPHRQAIDEIARCKGRQFDPAVAQAFVQLYFDQGPEYPDLSSGLRGLSVEAIRAGA